MRVMGTGFLVAASGCPSGSSNRIGSRSNPRQWWARPWGLSVVSSRSTSESVPVAGMVSSRLALNKTLEVWLSGVELALGEFDAIDYLPNRILLCGGGSSLKRITEALKDRKWDDNLPFTKKPVVQYIKPSDVTGIVDTTGSEIDHTFITAMGLLRVGYDTIIGSQDGNGLMEKVNRLLKI